MSGLDFLPAERRRLFIGGQWTDAEGGGTFDVLDPADGSVLCQVADATVADGRRALDAAVGVQDDWARTNPRDRGEILRGTFELVAARSDEFAELMSLEMGKTLKEAAGEVAYGNEFLRWFSEEAVRVTGRYGLNPEGTGRMVVSQRPVGPCFLITPWNFPLAMATRKIAPALAAGCTVVVKPAELTPLTTLYFAKVLQEVGLGYLRLGQPGLDPLPQIGGQLVGVAHGGQGGDGHQAAVAQVEVRAPPQVSLHHLLVKLREPRRERGRGRVERRGCRHR